AAGGSGDDDRRFRLQNRERTIPRVVTGRVRRCADPGHRFPLDWFEGRRVLVFLSCFYTDLRGYAVRPEYWCVAQLTVSGDRCAGRDGDPDDDDWQSGCDRTEQHQAN